MPHPLEQRKLWRHGPAKGISKDGIVGKGDDVLEQPKVGSILTVEKVSGWHEFNVTVLLPFISQIVSDISVKPRLVPSEKGP